MLIPYSQPGMIHSSKGAVPHHGMQDQAEHSLLTGVPRAAVAVTRRRPVSRAFPWHLFGALPESRSGFLHSIGSRGQPALLGAAAVAPCTKQEDTLPSVRAVSIRPRSPADGCRKAGLMGVHISLLMNPPDSATAAREARFLKLADGDASAGCLRRLRSWRSH